MSEFRPPLEATVADFSLRRLVAALTVEAESGNEEQSRFQKDVAMKDILDALTQIDSDLPSTPGHLEWQELIAALGSMDASILSLGATIGDVIDAALLALGGVIAVPLAAIATASATQAAHMSSVVDKLQLIVDKLGSTLSVQNSGSLAISAMPPLNIATLPTVHAEVSPSDPAGMPVRYLSPPGVLVTSADPQGLLVHVVGRLPVDANIYTGESDGALVRLPPGGVGVNVLNTPLQVIEQGTVSVAPAGSALWPVNVSAIASANALQFVQSFQQAGVTYRALLGVPLALNYADHSIYRPMIANDIGSLLVHEYTVLSTPVDAEAGDAESNGPPSLDAPS